MGDLVPPLPKHQLNNFEKQREKKTLYSRLHLSFLAVVKLHTAISGSIDEEEEEKQGGSTIFQSISRWMEAKGGRRTERFNLI